MPTELMVADFFVYAPVPFAEHCLKDTVAYKKGKNNGERNLERGAESSGQGGYITPAASGVPTASERGAESEVAHKWARWLYNPCRLGGPHRFTAGGKI